MDIKIQRVLSGDVVVYSLQNYSQIVERIAHVNLADFIRPVKFLTMSIETEDDFEKTTGISIQSQAALMLIGCPQSTLEKIVKEAINIVFI